MLNDVEMSRLPTWKALIYVALMHALYKRPVLIQAGELDRLQGQDRYAEDVTRDLHNRPRLVAQPASAQGYRDLLSEPRWRIERGEVAIILE